MFFGKSNRTGYFFRPKTNSNSCEPGRIQDPSSESFFEEKNMKMDKHEKSDQHFLPFRIKLDKHAMD